MFFRCTAKPGASAASSSPASRSLERSATSRPGRALSAGVPPRVARLSLASGGALLRYVGGVVRLGEWPCEQGLDEGLRVRSLGCQHRTEEGYAAMANGADHRFGVSRVGVASSFEEKADVPRSVANASARLLDAVGSARDARRPRMWPSLHARPSEVVASGGGRSERKRDATAIRRGRSGGTPSLHFYSEQPLIRPLFACEETSRQITELALQCPVRRKLRHAPQNIRTEFGLGEQLSLFCVFRSRASVVFFCSALMPTFHRGSCTSSTSLSVS